MEIRKADLIGNFLREHDLESLRGHGREFNDWLDAQREAGNLHFHSDGSWHNEPEPNFIMDCIITFFPW